MHYSVHAREGGPPRTAASNRSPATSMPPPCEVTAAAMKSSLARGGCKEGSGKVHLFSLLQAGSAYLAGGPQLSARPSAARIQTCIPCNDGSFLSQPWKLLAPRVAPLGPMTSHAAAHARWARPCSSVELYWAGLFEDGPAVHCGRRRWVLWQRRTDPKTAGASGSGEHTDGNATSDMLRLFRVFSRV